MQLRSTETASNASRPGAIVDFLRHLHESSEPVLSWHAMASTRRGPVRLKADRFETPLRKVVRIVDELVVASPTELSRLTDLSGFAAEQIFDESKALETYLGTCAVEPSSRNIVLSSSNDRISDGRHATLSYSFAIDRTRGTRFDYKVSEVEQMQQSMLDSEAWTASIAGILEAWSVGVLRSHNLLSISGTDRNRTRHCRARAVKPSPLRPFVPGLQLAFSSQKGRDLALSALLSHGVDAEASELCRDVFRRVSHDHTEVTIAAAQDPNLKRLLADWCLG